MIIKIVRKYRELPNTAKAAAWYTICIFLQKLAAFLVIPFFTRILTTNDYGVYAVFLSWTSIIEILSTWRMYGNGFVAGMTRNREDLESYVSSVQLTCLITTSVAAGIAMFFLHQLSTLITLDEKMIVLMFMSFYPSSVIEIWSAKQRISIRYRTMVLATVMYSVVAPICSIVAAIIMPNKLEAAIETRVLAQIIIAAPFFFNNTFGNNRHFLTNYCKEALAYSLPLLPYYLSMVLLNSSDRIMVKHFLGETEAAKYSVAYSLGMIAFIFEGALNMALEPWLLDRIKQKNGNGVSKALTKATCFVAIMNLVVLVVAPELITVVASEKYADAVWAMPPVIASLLVIFIYQQILYVHFYYGETRTVFFASVGSAVLNIVLNLYLIPLLGYVAAGYTTLISYLLIGILCYHSMTRIATSRGLDYKEFYNINNILIICTVFLLVSLAIVLVYRYQIVRLGLVVVTIAGLIHYRQLFLDCIKSK